MGAEHFKIFHQFVGKTQCIIGFDKAAEDKEQTNKNAGYDGEGSHAGLFTKFD